LLPKITSLSRADTDGSLYLGLDLGGISVVMARTRVQVDLRLILAAHVGDTFGRLAECVRFVGIVARAR